MIKITFTAELSTLSFWVGSSVADCVPAVCDDENLR